MSTLEEDMKALVELVPKLPREATAAVEAATALLAAANPVREEIAALAAAADEAGTVVSSLGQAFAKHANELEQHLREVLGETQESWGAARAAVTAAADGTFDEAVTFQQAKDALLETFVWCEEAVDPSEQAEPATERLRSTAEEAGNDLVERSNELQAGMTVFEEILSDRVPRLNAATEGLMRWIEEMEDRLREQAETLVATLSTKAAELDQALRASLAGLAADLEDQRALATQSLLDEVGRPLEEAGDGAQQALAAVGTSAADRDRRLAEARLEFVQAFAELEAAARPLPATIEQIHEAYQKVDGL